MNNAKYKLGFLKMIIFKISNKTVSVLFNSLLYIVLLLLLSNCNTKDKNEYTSIQNNSVEATFVGSKSCKTCHQEEFKSWEGSHHDQAMKIADSTTILADFNNTTFTHNKVKSSFFKKEGAFYVNTEGPDGNYYDYKIVYTFGFTPLQQYIVAFPNGEFQCLLTAWDSVKNKWFHLQPNLDIIHDEWINWSGGSQRWNTMCADCHSTNLQKNYDSKTTTYNTTYSEINVACEACHGPSSKHNAYYENLGKNESGATEKSNYYFSGDKNVIPPKLDMTNILPSKELVNKCARCHSRRSQITKVFDYKGEFLDHYYPSLLEYPVYELDGQIKDEDYVYGSFMQSKMYSKGISCKNCHDVHSLKKIKTGNDLCLTCHVPAYNEPSHHYHKVNTEGAQCINCHMTGKTYMGNDFRRDHSFRIPRPDQTVKYNTPNACNGCHTDKSAKWASDFIVEKYGAKRADHFSDHLLKGYFEDINGFKELFSNTSYPEIARATALKQYSNQPLSLDEILALTMYLKDSSAMVRTETIRALERIGNTDLSNKIKPLLMDSIRVVRISAARYFNMTREDMSTNNGFKKANKEFLEELDMNSDFASGQQQMALYYQAKGNDDAAVKAYKRAIEIDNRFNRARMNLALLYYQRGLIKESEALYLKIIEQEPEFSYSYYMLGLLYNETGNDKKAMDYLKLATEKEPVNMNAFYNYALKLQQEGENIASIKVINKGLNIFFNNERLLYVKLIGEINLKQTANAKNTCNLLIEIAPDNSNYKQILESLE